MLGIDQSYPFLFGLVYFFTTQGLQHLPLPQPQKKNESSHAFATDWISAWVKRVVTPLEAHQAISKLGFTTTGKREGLWSCCETAGQHGNPEGFDTILLVRKGQAFPLCGNRILGQRIAYRLQHFASHLDRSGARRWWNSRGILDEPSKTCA